MGTIRYDFWIDESGNFLDENPSKNRKPSLIGGLLSKKGTITKDILEDIFPQNEFHSYDEKDSKEVFKKFKSIVERIVERKDAKIVLFENKKRVMIVNGSSTYFNIIAEGTIELIDKLVRENGGNFIELDLFISSRKNLKKEKDGSSKEREIPVYSKYFMPHYYEYLLKTRLILEGLDKSIDVKVFDERDKEGGKTDAKVKINLRIGNAESVKELMVADTICNVILTRDSNKFKSSIPTEAEAGKSMSAYINKVYNDKNKTVSFSVFKAFFSRFSNYLTEGKPGEAALYLCQYYDEKDIEKMQDDILAAFDKMTESEILMQYNMITSVLEYYLNVYSGYYEFIETVKKFKKYFIPILKKVVASAGTEDLSKRLELDLNFYLITAYTHVGNVWEAESCEKECDKLFNEIKGSDSIERLNYRVKFLNRKIVCLINRYDFIGAIKSANDLKETCERIKDALSLCFENEENMKYEELGKVLGSIVQANTFMIRGDKTNKYAEQAREASDKAIDEFDEPSRQYLYRVQLETECGRYDDALSFLKKSVQLKEDDNISQIVKAIKEPSIDKYKVMNYVRLMAEGALNNWDKAWEMFKEINSSDVISDIIDNSSKDHPKEITLWKWGCFLAKDGNMEAASERYEKALEICMTNNMKDLTIAFIGLAVYFEYYSFLLKDSKHKAKAKETLSKMEKYYKKVYSSKLPESMKGIFAGVDFNSKNPEYFYNLSRRITY